MGRLPDRRSTLRPRKARSSRDLVIVTDVPGRGKLALHGDRHGRRAAPTRIRGDAADRPPPPGRPRRRREAHHAHLLLHARLQELRTVPRRGGAAAGPGAGNRDRRRPPRRAGRRGVRGVRARSPGRSARPCARYRGSSSATACCCRGRMRYGPRLAAALDGDGEARSRSPSRPPAPSSRRASGALALLPVLAGGLLDGDQSLRVHHADLPARLPRAGRPGRREVLLIGGLVHPRGLRHLLRGRSRPARGPPGRRRLPASSRASCAGCSSPCSRSSPCLSARDAVLAARGRASDMALQLPGCAEAAHPREHPHPGALGRPGGERARARLPGVGVRVRLHRAGVPAHPRVPRAPRRRARRAAARGVQPRLHRAARRGVRRELGRGDLARARPRSSSATSRPSRSALAVFFAALAVLTLAT